MTQLTQPADSSRLLVRHGDELVPLHVSSPPSFFATAPSPTPPPLPLAQDERVYTYVAEPPRLATSSPVSWHARLGARH